MFSDFGFGSLGLQSKPYRGERVELFGGWDIDLCCLSTSVSLGADFRTIGHGICDISEPLLEAQCVPETQHSASHEAHRVAQTRSWLLMARAG